ncbi:Mad3/BUB1 homology region 1-domain-containing protein [Irpex rosettiformis]|uniref:Mad3/BUB1 homology region 1-domain-containing protein n=1 Tax=Irpex rosettiformis TaxID=378272 RepID=A0ACB8U7F1_9APHY|nr:Mad3/BUB1 homology region 1-domain-containing protein [Irpex rosettiformis]
MADCEAYSDAEETAPIIDCDVLEAAKENIQPLAKGRRVTALSAILATPHAQRENQLTATRQRMRMNVDLALENSELSDEEDEADNDTDPLDAYCTYVHWVVENYPQGHSAESGLLELLEEATRVLKDHQHGRWRNDIRYLKLWVLYASYVEKPTIVYKFCLVNEIGSEHALLYEEAALALERAGRKPEADQTYSLGIARKAKPLDHLEVRYREFQKRMMASPSLPSATPAVTDATAPSANAPAEASGSRRVLRETVGTSRASRMTRSSSRLAAASSSRLAAASSSRLAAASSSSSLTTPVHIKPQPNARIPVFVDGQDELVSIGQDNAPSAWPDLGTRKSRIKENVKEATKASGATLKQAGRSTRTVTSSRTPKISVFRDPEPKEGDQPTVEVSSELPLPHTPLSMPSRSGSSRSVPVFRDDDPEQVQLKSSKLKHFASGKGFAVLRDEDKPEPSHQTRLGEGFDVFRNDIAEPFQSKSSKSDKGIAVFRDEEHKPLQKASVSKGGKKIAVLHNDSDAEPSQKTKSSKAKKGIAIFRDDSDAEPPQKVKRIKPTKSISVFRDEELENTTSESTLTKTLAPSEHKTRSIIPIFCDDVVVKQPEVAPGKSKEAVTIFRDEETVFEDTAGDAQSSPTTGFTPFKDEDDNLQAPVSEPKNKAIGLGILGQGASSSIAKMSSEAEALRKDPLKNYPTEERTSDIP